MISKLEQIIEAAQKNGRKRLVAAYANDAHTIEAVADAVNLGVVDATLIGDIDTMKRVCSEVGVDSGIFTLVQENDDTKCVLLAVKMINNGKADILMKGLVSTDKYMRGILQKEGGLVPPRGVLSHVTVLDIPVLNRLLIISDVAVIPAPDIDQKIALTRYVINIAHALGNPNPKVAIIAPTEQVLHKMQSCSEAAIISKMADRKQITGAVVDGPLALDVALDKDTAIIKKLESPVAGVADCLVFPNIESANVFFKTSTKLLNAQLAAMVVGARVPCVLTSRGDTKQSKLYSIALAALTTK